MLRRRWPVRRREAARTAHGGPAPNGSTTRMRRRVPRRAILAGGPLPRSSRRRPWGDHDHRRTDDLDSVAQRSRGHDRAHRDVVVGEDGARRDGQRRDRTRRQRDVERDPPVHRAAGHGCGRALRRPAGATRVPAVPGVPRVRPRVAAARHADGRRAHRRAGPRGRHPRDRPRVARVAVPAHAPHRRRRPLRHPAVHHGRLAVRRRAGRPADARARVGARARPAARPHPDDARPRVPRPSAVRRERARPAPRLPALVLRLGPRGSARPAHRADLRRARRDAARWKGPPSSTGATAASAT